MLEPKESPDNLSFVDGRILIAAETGTFSGGTAHIFLEDVSRADAPSRIVAKTRIANISHQSGDAATNVSFRIDFSDAAFFNPKNYYSLRVWIDVSDDGEQNTDDLYSDQIYPVLTRGAGNFAEILLNSPD